MNPKLRNMGANLYQIMQHTNKNVNAGRLDIQHVCRSTSEFRSLDSFIKDSLGPQRSSKPFSLKKPIISELIRQQHFK